MHPLDRLRIVGTREVREILNVSDTYVYNEIILKKLIHAKRISCGWLFLKDDVLEFKKRREEKAKTDKRIRLKKRN